MKKFFPCLPFSFKELPGFPQIFIIFFAYLIGNFCNYCYQIYVGRILGPEEYGEFGSLFAIIYLIFIFGYTIQLGIAWKTTKILVNNKNSAMGGFIHQLLKKGFLVSIIFFIIFFLISPFIGIFLNYYNNFDFFLLGLVIICTFLLSITLGIIQGLQKQITLSLLNIVTYFPKLLFAIIFLSWGLGLSGALAAQPLGMLVAFLLSFLPLLSYLRQNTNQDLIDLGDVYYYSIPTFIVMICLAVPSNVDLIIAKHLYNNYDTGLYVAASIIGKIVLFISATISILIFPKSSEYSFLGKDTFTLYNYSLLYTLILSGLTSIIFIAFPNTIEIIFGMNYSAGRWIVQSYVILMLIFSLIWVTAHYSLAVRKFGYTIILSLFTIIEIAALLIFQPTMRNMLLMLICFNLVLFIIGYIYLYQNNTKLGIVEI